MADPGPTVLRSLVVPVVGPVDLTWPELRASLRVSWAAATACANWMLTELYARDVRRSPDLARLPRMPRVYLYPEARHRWPELASQTVATLEREVGRRYRQARHGVLWTGAQSLPSLRYPVALPLPRQMWRLVRIEEAWGISLRLIDRRVTLRLRGGAHVARQTRLLAQIDQGQVEAGAAYLYQRVAHLGDHRTGITRQARLLVRLSVELPVRTPTTSAGVLQVRTAPDALLVATTGAQTWTEHMTHLVRAIRRAERQQAELRDDLKAERQRPKRQRAGIVARMGEISRRRSHQVGSGLHEAASHLVGYAARQRVAALEYDDSERRYCPLLPWHRLRSLIREKCAARGIEFQASGPATETAAEPLAIAGDTE